MYNTVCDIREEFMDRFFDERFVIDKTGVKTIEIVNASFIADENTIFGMPNEDYIKREIQWYESQSLNVNHIPGGPPAIWKQVADTNGFINSNYGWCIYSNDNGNQFDHVLIELGKNPDSRRAIMIYTRPSMWNDYNAQGRSDFMCTNAVQYLIRDGRVNAVVQMRSNDAWAGYRNDYAWQKHVLEFLTSELRREYEVGDIFWNVGSLHVYDRQFYLIDHYMKTGEFNITKQEYDELYKLG